MPDPQTVKKPRPKKYKKRRKPGPVRPGQHLLLRPQVLEVCGGASYSTIWDWMQNQGFPLPLTLGPPEGRTSRVAWVASEVYEWLALRPRRAIGQLREIREAQEKPGSTSEKKKNKAQLAATSRALT